MTLSLAATGALSCGDRRCLVRYLGWCATCSGDVWRLFSSLSSSVLLSMLLLRGAAARPPSWVTTLVGRFREGPPVSRIGVKVFRGRTTAFFCVCRVAAPTPGEISASRLAFFSASRVRFAPLLIFRGLLETYSLSYLIPIQVRAWAVASRFPGIASVGIGRPDSSSLGSFPLTLRGFA